MNPQDRLFGEIAVRLNLLTREQVAMCLQEQSKESSHRRLGEVAVTLGYLSDDQMKMALEHQRRIMERRRGGPAAKAAAKPAAKPAPSPAAKPAAKPAPKPAAKPAAKPAPTPAAKRAAKPSSNTKGTPAARPAAMAAVARLARPPDTQDSGDTVQSMAPAPEQLRPATPAKPAADKPAARAIPGGRTAINSSDPLVDAAKPPPAVRAPSSETISGGGGWANAAAPSQPVQGASLPPEAADGPEPKAEVVPAAEVDESSAKSGNGADDASGFGETLAAPIPGGGDAGASWYSDDGPADSAAGGAATSEPSKPGDAFGSASTEAATPSPAPDSPASGFGNAATMMQAPPAPQADPPSSVAEGTQVGFGESAEPAAVPTPTDEPAAAGAAAKDDADEIAKARAADEAQSSPSKVVQILKAPLQRPRVATPPGQESYIVKLLRMAVEHRASDLHIHSGAEVLARIDGKLRPMSSGKPMKPKAAEKVIAEFLTDDQWRSLALHGETDFGYEIKDLARFRVNVYRQHRGFDIVFRIVPIRVPTLEELGMPALLAKLTDYRTGLVLCTGPTGCGKSTTLASMVNIVAQTKTDHIITIEDPIEFVYPSGKCVINQREVRHHTESYSRALRAALREDPDIIVIAELRDLETISLAMSAAETGHLVLGTLHTSDAAQTISRLVSVFPAKEQNQVRTMLADSLRAIISQRLVPNASGEGRTVAIELLMITTAVANMVRDNKTSQIASAMQTGKATGMITLDDSLVALVEKGTVTAEDARRFATRKDRFGG